MPVSLDIPSALMALLPDTAFTSMVDRFEGQQVRWQNLYFYQQRVYNNRIHSNTSAVKVKAESLGLRDTEAQTSYGVGSVG